MNILDLGDRLRKSVVFKNAVYLGVIQIVNYVFPLLTIPYLIKILGVSRFGTIAYSQLIVSYLCIISDYGFNLSATRDISLNKENKKSLNRIFSAVIYLKLLIGVVSCLVAAILIFYLPMFQSFRSVYLISLAYVFGQIIFPTWLFQGMENMGQLTFFNSVFKIIFTGSVFWLVRSPDDIELVSIIYVVGSVVSGTAAFLFGIRKYRLKFLKVSVPVLKKTLYDAFDVFIPSFFAGVVNSGGVFILGMFYPTALVGYYSAIDRLVKAGTALLSTITQSLFPSIAYKFSRDKRGAILEIIKIGKLIVGVLLLVLVLCIFISPYILSIIFDSTYRQYAYVLDVLIVWTVFAFINNFIGIQFLVGSGHSKYYRMAFLISGIGMMLTFIFIKYFGINGVLFSTITGEVLLTFSMIYYIKKYKLYEY